MGMKYPFGVIYKITNQLDGKYYIGQTIQASSKRFYRAGFFASGINANISGKIKTTYKGYKWQRI